MREEAIYNVYPTVVSTIGNKAFDKDGNPVSLDESAITTEVVKLQSEYDAPEYARNRQDEYPPMADQLDYMFHNGFDKWKEDIVQPVKDKYPKPE